ncbi:hypothetical protein ACOSQ3_025379 [Xanthoceras sorbifolium]
MFGDTLDTGLTILMANLVPPPPDYTNPCSPPPLLVPAIEKLDCFFQKNKKTTWPTYLLPTFFITYLTSTPLSSSYQFSSHLHFLLCLKNLCCVCALDLRILSISQSHQWKVIK